MSTKMEKLIKRAGLLALLFLRTRNQSKATGRIHIITCVLLALTLCGSAATAAYAQAVSITRIDGRPSGHSLDSGGSDPIMDTQLLATFNATGKAFRNINGPSVIRVPDWIPGSERIHLYVLRLSQRRLDSSGLGRNADR